MSRKYIPLSIPNFNGNEWRYVKKCIDTAWVSTAGEFVQKFEQEICEYTSSKHAVACMNGTSGLFIALKLSDVGPGDEVLVPDLTFIAPINAIKYTGAEPVFMDCDDFMNIDPVKIREFVIAGCVKTKKGLKNKKTGKLIKAIMPVHVFGNPCDMESLMFLAKEYGLKVIEDATESLGSYYTKGKYKGKYTGTIGDFGVYSFNGNKIITTGGGGMIVTSSQKLAHKAEYLTNQAKDDAIRYIHNEIGYNFRLTNIQAALGLAQMEQLDEFIKTKKLNYELFNKGLAGIKGVKFCGVPDFTIPNYWFYSILIDKNEFGMDRESLMNHLEIKGIQTRPIWFLSHLQKPYLKNQSYKINKALCFWERTLNLPCSTNLKSNDIQYIISIIKEAGKKHG